MMKKLFTFSLLLFTSLFTFAANAAEVRINGVGMVDPWDGAKGAVTVDYSLLGLEADIRYKVMFEFTANGRTVSVTNDAAMLEVGRQPPQTIDTVTLFRGAVADKDAAVKVTLIAVRPVPGVQLWRNGPFFDVCNVGAKAPEDTVPALDFREAWKSVSEPWRLPSIDELEKLTDPTCCEWTWDDNGKGWTFKGKDEYSSNSIFLPAGGYDGDYVGVAGLYWSSTFTWSQHRSCIYLDHSYDDKGRTYDVGENVRISARAVRNADSSSWKDVAEADMRTKFPLGVTEVTLPSGMAGYRYAVSNLTAGVEIEAVTDGRYVLSLGAKVGVYAVPETGYAIVGTNPHVIENVTLRTAIDASQLPKVPPTVMINEIKSVDPWDGEKGPVMVDYTLAGLDSSSEYKVTFDITANGRTVRVTNDAAKLSDGRQAELTCDTAELFGEVVVADDAEMRISLIALKASGEPEREEVVESVAEARFLLGMTEIVLPTGMVVYHHVVSNLTGAATEVASAGDGRYVLPIGARVGVYAVPETGYAIVGTNPYVIEKVASDTPVDEDALPKVPPTVIIRRVETSDPWNGEKGAVTVDYSLAGLEAGWWYRVAFDITANGRTVCVTNEEAKLPEGTQVRKTIETTSLFGEETVDKDATVKVSLIAVTPVPDGQLWANGPIWAESNLGESEDGGHPEYGALYDYDSATNAVAKLGDGWRLPTGEEFVKLTDASVCRSERDDERNGWIFWGKGSRSPNSIFLPLAGSAASAGDVRQIVGVGGVYRSSTVVGSDGAQVLFLARDGIGAPTFLSIAICISVRVVKDADEAEVIEKASAETGFRLGPGGESCPWKVTVGEHPHMSAAWTGGDGSVTNEIEGTSFRVLDDTANVKVIFTADDGWGLEGEAVVSLGTVTEDIVFGKGNGYRVPWVGFLTPYLDYDAATGTFTNAVRACTLVTSETRELNGGWYAVKDEVDLPKGERLKVLHDVRLILCDGASLTITNVNGRFAAVTVTDNNRLTVYGQTKGTGLLTAWGGEDNAGIGGYCGKWFDDFWLDRPQDCGRVTINGGTIVAKGGNKGAGIGGSTDANGGTLTINGGTVTAQGGRGAAGIGNAYERHECRVTITGGKVTARKGQRIDDWEADDIGYGECRGQRQPGVGVMISGGIFANRPKDEWCLEHYVPVDNTDPETSADYPYIVQRQCVVDFVMRPPRVNIAWTSGDGSVTNAVYGSGFDLPPGTEDVRVIVTPTVDLPLDGAAVIDLGTVTGDITFGDGNDYRIPHPYSPFGDIAYLDWNGSEMTKAVLPSYDYLPVTEATRELGTDWYAVTNDVVLPDEVWLQVKGNARLVLCDGASLTITNGPAGRAAVEVAIGKSLTIYGQAGNTGTLTAWGSEGGAGIGGANETTSGMVTINGGTVLARGSDFGGECGGAGIGGGYLRNGNVEIHGGRVAAQGGGLADDIGGGEYAQDASSVTISGGIFWEKFKDAWLASDRLKIPNPDEATKADYPWMVVPQSCTVTVGRIPHVATVAWTTGDGSVTNTVEGRTFSVSGGFENVKVIFTAEPGWEIVGENVVNLGTVTANIVFGEEGGFAFPEVKITDPCTILFGRNRNMSIAWTSGDGSVTNGVVSGAVSLQVPRGSENVRMICTADPGYELVGQSVFDFITVTTDIEFSTGDYKSYKLPAVYDSANNVVYLDWDEVNGRMTNAVARTSRKEWEAVSDATTALKGCMVVTNDVTIPSARVIGAAVLVLCNDATLTVTGEAVTGEEDDAGIRVPNGASLTITVRKGFTGRVVAQGAVNCAGIGSQFKQGPGSALGAVRIVAGTVTATGGKNGAGIGNGFFGKGGSVKIFGGAVTAVGGYGAASDIGDGYDPYSPCEVSISGGIFARELKGDWLAPGYAAVANEDEATRADYPWTIADNRLQVSPGEPLGPFDTAKEATNAMNRAVFAPSEEVAGVLGTVAARTRYAGWFDFGVTSKGASEWYVETVLTDAAKAHLADTAAKATRQIPISVIAALPADGTKDVPVDGCEPGFYYTLRGSGSLEGLGGLEGSDVYGPNLSGMYGEIEFPAVKKPSDAAGFFTIGVSAAKGGGER